MSVPLYAPPAYVAVYAYCIDDSLPRFTPDNWVKRDRVYKVKWFAEGLNTDSTAVTIADNKGEVIHPSDSMSAFKVDRFIIFQFILN